MSDHELRLLRSYVGEGGGLVVTGRSGMCDGRFRMRTAHPFLNLFDHPRVVFLPDNPERLSRPHRDHPPAYHDMHLPERADEIVDAILTACEDRLPYRVSASEFLGTDAYELRSGKRVIHLLNYDNENPLENVGVTLSEQLSATEAVLLTPDAEEVEEEKEELTGRGDFFFVGHLETYAILVLPAARD